MSFQVAIKENEFWIELFICTMSQYPSPRHYCRTLQDLEFYPLVERREMKSIDVQFQIEVGYWVSLNHLQDYKIYGTMIKMFCLKFLNILWQPCRDNPWPTHLTNQNYRMQFDKQHDYLLGFQGERRINKLILLWKWLRNVSNDEDNAYKTLVLAYNIKLNLLVLTNSIIGSSVEEESSPPYPEDVVINSEEETTYSEDTTLTTTS